MLLSKTLFSFAEPLTTMATRTIKIGSSASVKNLATHGVIERIENGGYYFKGSKKMYRASELVGDKIVLAQKPRKPINQVSAQTKLLKQAYIDLRFEYLLHNKLCRANLSGCTGAAKEIHHMNGRSGFWLIISKFFLPVCRCCHKQITKNSALAIEKGLSTSRTYIISYDFCSIEFQIMEKYGISPP